MGLHCKAVAVIFRLKTDGQGTPRSHTGPIGGGLAAPSQPPALLASPYLASCAMLFSFREINASLPSGERNKSGSLMRPKKVRKKFRFDGLQVCLFGLAHINQRLASIRCSQRSGPR